MGCRRRNCLTCTSSVGDELIVSAERKGVKQGGFGCGWRKVTSPCHRKLAGGSGRGPLREESRHTPAVFVRVASKGLTGDRKSTRLNSSHGSISYAVFCLKKKKTRNTKKQRHTKTQN